MIIIILNVIGITITPMEGNENQKIALPPIIAPISRSLTDVEIVVLSSLVISTLDPLNGLQSVRYDIRTLYALVIINLRVISTDVLIGDEQNKDDSKIKSFE